MESDKDAQTLSAKLNVMISLLLDIKESLGEKMSLKGKIAYLVRAGLSNKEISKILGISEKHVSKEKALLKKNG